MACSKLQAGEKLRSESVGSSAPKCSCGAGYNIDLMSSEDQTEFDLNRTLSRFDVKKVETQRGFTLQLTFLLSLFVLVLLARFILDLNLLFLPAGS